MFIWATQGTNFEKLDCKFMISGFSHIEVDIEHVIIDKKKRKTG